MLTNLVVFILGIKVMQFIKKLLERWFPNSEDFFSEEMRENAYKTIVMVHTPNDGGFGTGVLLKHDFVITAAHNFLSTPPKSSIIHRPSDGGKSSVKSAIIDAENDLALLRLRKSFKEPFAKVDLDSEEGEDYFPVMTPVFFDPFEKNEQLYFDCLNKGDFQEWFKPDSYTGFVARFEAAVKMADGRYYLRSLFNLSSTHGFSGTGIFTQDIKLLALDTGGNGRQASGPSIPAFRKFLIDNNLV